LAKSNHRTILLSLELAIVFSAAEWFWLTVPVGVLTPSVLIYSPVVIYGNVSMP